MKCFGFLSILLCVCCTLGHAQRHEVGVLLGGANYIGEIGSTQYINPRHYSGGIIYKRNLTQRISLRGQFTIGKLSANDINATDLDRLNRGFSFTNSFSAWGVGMEVNYVPLPIGDFGTSWTPFLHVGLQRMVVKDLYFPPLEKTASTLGKNSTMSVPFGVGVKVNLGQYWVVAAEIQPQFTFTDNIDGSFPNIKKQPMAQKFSTSLSSDWVVFTGISITYAFGRLPCCRE